VLAKLRNMHTPLYPVLSNRLVYHSLTGGAVLKLPADAQPGNVVALLALVCGVGQGREDPSPTAQQHHLQTLHLDLSGHPLRLDMLRGLLISAPYRQGQCFMLEGLVLAGCNLTLGACAMRHQRC
jgi:hypothetical protein